MKHGFMLVELIVSTLIASMIAAVLLTALAQSSRFQAAVDNVVDTSLRIGVASYQLEKDLMGAFIPVQAEPEKKEEKKTVDTKVVSNDGKKGEAQQGVDKQQKKEKPKPIEKIFYSTNKEKNLDQLTFITNNPLSVFVGKDVGVVKPKIARVVYTLKPDADQENSYILYRQESLDLDLAQMKNVKSYELMSGIKSLSINYTARIEKKQEEAKKTEGQSASKEKSKISYEYKTLPDWISERKKEGDKEQEFPRIPYSIAMKITLWDQHDKGEKEYDVVCEIPVVFKPDLQDASSDSPAPQAEESKNSAGPQKDAISAKAEQEVREVAHSSPSKKTEVITTVTNIVKNVTKAVG